MLTYIIAGNYQEGINFVKKHKIYPYKIVTSIEHVIGQRDIHGYLVGTWRDLENIQEILLSILVRIDDPIRYNKLTDILESIGIEKLLKLPVYQNQWTAFKRYQWVP
jgi:hypothetical protein